MGGKLRLLNVYEDRNCRVCKQILPHVTRKGLKAHEKWCRASVNERNNDDETISSVLQDCDADLPLISTFDESISSPFCAICSSDLSHLNNFMRNLHANECIDSRCATLKNVKLVCPICSVVVKQQYDFANHLKKCSKENEIRIGTLANMLQSENISLTQIHSDYHHPPRRRNIHTKIHLSPKPIASNGKIYDHLKIRNEIIDELEQPESCDAQTDGYAVNLGCYGGKKSSKSLWQLSCVKETEESVSNAQNHILKHVELSSQEQKSTASTAFCGETSDSTVVAADSNEECDYNIICKDGSVPAMSSIIHLRLGRNVDDLSAFSSQAVSTFLKFFYCSKINLSDLSNNEYAEIMQISNRLNYTPLKEYLQSIRVPQKKDIVFNILWKRLWKRFLGKDKLFFQLFQQFSSKPIMNLENPDMWASSLFLTLTKQFLTRHYSDSNFKCSGSLQPASYHECDSKESEYMSDVSLFSNDYSDNEF